MKTKLYFLIALIFFLSSFQTFAQSNFAPVGATWHHSGFDKNNQIFKTVAYKDTIILGQNCRELKQTLYFSKPLSFPYMHFYHASRNLYVYGTEDTVFIYNEVYKRFTPLYIFNVKVGDTVRLPYIRPINCPYVMSDTNDASLGYVVDSVKDVNYDGQLLKTVYSTVLKTKHSYFGWGGFKNVFAQKIGSPNFGLLPTCLYNCAYTAGEDVCPFLDSLICYEDKDISIKFRDTCLPSTWVPAFINEKTTSTQKLEIYPNPANDKISLGFEAKNFQSKVIIVDVMGKKVIEKDFLISSTLSIDVAELKSGVYFIKLLKEGEITIGSGSFVKL